MDDRKHPSHLILLFFQNQKRVQPREDAVQAKGKGVLSTFWVNVKQTGASRTSGDSNSDAGGDDDRSVAASVELSSERISKEQSVQRERLVNWVVEKLLSYIQQVSVVNQVKTKEKATKVAPSDDFTFAKEGTYLDEVVESITLPKFDHKAVFSMANSREAFIDSVVVKQLRDLVTDIASTYHNENPFHNVSYHAHDGSTVAFSHSHNGTLMTQHLFLTRLLSSTAFSRVSVRSRLSRADVL